MSYVHVMQLGMEPKAEVAKLWPIHNTESLKDISVKSY